MPFYTFECTKCDHKFTGRYSFDCSEGEGVSCPQCGGDQVNRVIDKAPGLIVKHHSGSSGSCSSCSGGTCSLCNE